MAELFQNQAVFKNNPQRASSEPKRTANLFSLLAAFLIRFALPEAPFPARGSLRRRIARQDGSASSQCHIFGSRQLFSCQGTRGDYQLNRLSIARDWEGGNYKYSVDFLKNLFS